MKGPRRPARRDDGELTTEQLAGEITTLAAHISAATCRWLELIGEFDAREGWAEWGCRGTAHWIAWRCSIVPGAAREQVRVARRLRDLPLIRAAFAAGELSYSKVRALTRVEDVADEAALLDMARHVTAAQLERTVRGYRRVVEADELRAHAERYLRLDTADDGSLIVRGKFPREEGAVLAKAIEVARELLAKEAPDVLSAPRDVSTEPRDVSTEPRGVSAETPSDTGRTASAQASRPEASTPDTYLAEELEPPSRQQANADALLALADASLELSGRRTGGDRFQVVLHVEADALAGDIGARADLQDGTPLAVETVRRLCCDAALVPMVERDGELLSVGRKTRSIPPALRRALRARDGGCRFPGCWQRRWVDAHHIEHWAHGGETKLTNLVELCRHHHRLLHEGGFTIAHGRDDELVFRRPDGRRLHHAPRPPAGHPRRLRDANRGRGIRPTAETPVPRWCGERLRLGDAVDAVLSFTARPHEGPDGPLPEATEL